MPITFDTLDELKAFYRAFRIEEKSGNGHSKLYAPAVEVEKVSKRGRPGRKPGRPKLADKLTAKRGPKPKAVTASKFAAKPKREKGDTLTSKIQESIGKYLNTHRSFTANDIYDDLAKQNPGINKQSVITSVLKQMNSTFKTISVTERPGNGPRPVKLYNA
jgi:hypothetical protein